MIKLAIQKKGRLTSGTLDILKRGGFEFEDKSSGLINPCKNFPLELLLLRDEDIPEAVETGAADLGIVGGNILDEFISLNRNSSLVSRLSLPFSSCRLSIGIPNSFLIESLNDLKNCKIATSYPGILKRFSDENNLGLIAVILNGSVEIATSLKMADGIFDLVSTGETLKQNSLREFYQVNSYSPVVISGRKVSDFKNQSISEILTRMQSAVVSATSRYLVFNVSKSKLDEITKSLPAIDGPTLMEIATDANKVAIHTVVQKKDLWSVISKIKSLGASGILSFPVEVQIN